MQDSPRQASPLSRLQDVQQQIQAQTPPGKPVRLIAVSKGQSAEKAKALHSLGLRDFGENRLQEAEEKYTPMRKAGHKFTLHMVGPLQSKKAQKAVALFDVFHTLDRERIIEAIAEQSEKQARTPSCFLQVNVASEPQKSGCHFSELDNLYTRACARGLEICGLMCLPPQGEDPTPHFRELAKRAHALGLARLSMGMSHDFPLAIECGATDVRVGTSLFGAREPLPAPLTAPLSDSGAR